MAITDIGEDLNSQLICVTSNVRNNCCNSNRAHWRYPNNSRVATLNELEGNNFTSHLGNGEIRLLRRATASGPTGVYQCVVMLPNDNIIAANVLITGSKRVYK